MCSKSYSYAQLDKLSLTEVGAGRAAACFGAEEIQSQ